MPLPEEELIDDPKERLRAAFAKLMLQGQGNAPVPVESLWLAQSMNQGFTPKPDLPTVLDKTVPMDAFNQNEVRTPQLQGDQALNFPTAQAGPLLQNNPATRPDIPPTPFPGAESVEPVRTDRPYSLPKSPEKKRPYSSKLMPKMSGDKDEED